MHIVINIGDTFFNVGKCIYAYPPSLGYVGLTNTY